MERSKIKSVLFHFSLVYQCCVFHKLDKLFIGSKRVLLFIRLNNDKNGSCEDGCC